MSVQAKESDVELLHKMGYAQELRRRMSTFSNFAVSFTIISILSGALTRCHHTEMSLRIATRRTPNVLRSPWRKRITAYTTMMCGGSSG